MTLLGQAKAYLHMQRALSYDAARLRAVQWRKLRDLVAHAYASVPFYRQRFVEAGITPADLRSLDDLARLPVLTKADLQAADPDALVSDRYDRAALVREQTTGSSGRPLVMHFDKGYCQVRQALFLRALRTCGYLPGQRMLIVATPKPRGVPAWLRWRYLSHEDPPEQNLDALNAFRPRLLYGWVTPLRRMAELARQAGRRVHRPHAIVTTAESLDPATHRLLAATFHCPVYEVYGLTETGAIAWRSPGHRSFRASHESLILEFLPAPDGGAARRLVVTNLMLRSMPFIRYDTGDLAVPTAEPGEDALPSIERVEGRRVDCLRLPGGHVVSPYQLTLAMERVGGMVRYQILQDEPEAFTIRYEGKAADAARVEASAARVIREVLGDRARVAVRREASLDPPPGRKFRVVESRLRAGGVA